MTKRKLILHHPAHGPARKLRVRDFPPDERPPAPGVNLLPPPDETPPDPLLEPSYYLEPGPEVECPFQEGKSLFVEVICPACGQSHPLQLKLDPSQADQPLSIPWPRGDLLQCIACRHPMRLTGLRKEMLRQAGLG